MEKLQAQLVIVFVPLFHFSYLKWKKKKRENLFLNFNAYPFLKLCFLLDFQQL